MSVDPRAALDRFIAALEGHFRAIESRRGDDDPAVDDAYYVLADAFEVYDDALNEAYGEATPFEVEDDDEDVDRDDEDEVSADEDAEDVDVDVDGDGEDVDAEDDADYDDDDGVDDES